MRSPILFCLVIFVLLDLAPKVLGSDLPEVLVTTKPLVPGTVVLDKAEIGAAPVMGLADLLLWSGETDSSRRGSSQADLSLRASTFEQAGLTLDGFPVRDPQTGHFNLDVPLPLLLLDSVEISPVPWGHRGLAGSVNLVPRAPEKSLTALEGSAGSFSMRRGSGFVCVAPMAVWGEVFRSDGSRPDTDDRFRSAGAMAGLKDVLDSRAWVSYSDRKFGANDFYGNYPAYDEWEETETWLATWRGRVEGATGSWEPGLYWRRHKDRFLLDRYGRSSYSNRHTSQVFGGETRYARENFRGDLHGKGEWLDSSNLGDRSRASAGASGTLESGDGLLGLEVDILRGGVVQASPLLTAKAWPLEEVLLTGSISRAYREPSFTELYYRDPQNAGNTGLRPESAWNYELIPEWRANSLVVRADVFARLERGLIDWVRSDPSQPWRSMNIGKATVNGVGGRLEWTSGGFKLQAGHDFLERKADLAGLQSKYALNYPKHKAQLKGHGDLGPFGLSARGSRTWRTDGQVYNLVEGKISFNLEHGSIFASATNMLDSEFREVGGALLPGRAFQYGLGLSF